MVLDIVLKHTSDEYEWALKAKDGDLRHQGYDLTFEDRTVPDVFEQGMLMVFPEADPGNFTWNEEMKRWVMTAFHDYQWNLNYSNPEVFIEILSIVLF
nr:alpha-amylase family glycosyl hydrolase [Synechococcus sp. RedBA-s]